MADALLEPYVHAIDEFPLAGTPAAKLRAVLKYAVLAPSGHNTQPWLFRICEDAIVLYADLSRALPVVDPNDRELIMSCGAALFYLRAAIRHFGYEEEVETFPVCSFPELVAKIRLGSERLATAEDHALFAAIPHRRTNRLPFEKRPLPRLILAQLAAAAGREGAWLEVVSEVEGRAELAQLIDQGDRIQMADKRFRRELAAWIHSNLSTRADGMPGYAHGFNALVSELAPVILRTFDVGEGRAARDRELALGSPMLAVIGTEHDDLGDWLAAGQALARVLLVAEAQGISASFLNQPVEVPTLRRKLSKLVGRGGLPQLVLRLGYGRQVPATPRRPLEDVLIEE